MYLAGMLACFGLRALQHWMEWGSQVERQLSLPTDWWVSMNPHCGKPGHHLLQKQALPLWCHGQPPCQ